MQLLRNGASLARSLCFLWLAAFLLGSGPAPAQVFPAKSIRLLTPYPAGGSTDTLARIIGPKLSEALGVPVLVEAMPGANGSIAMSFLAKAPPDGYTILITTASPIVINPHTFPNIPYDAMKDFTPISLIATSESAIVVNSSVPANDLKELIELSKRQPVRIGVAGRGGQPELIIEKLNRDTGAKFIVVPYNGGGPAIVDTLGGHIEAVLNDLAGTITPNIASGKLRSVVVLTATPKSEMLPESTTLLAQSFPGHLALRSWLVLLGPRGMPPEITEKLRKTISDLVSQDDVVKRLRTASLLPYPSRSTTEVREFVTKEYEIFREIQKETGVKVQ